MRRAGITFFKIDGTVYDLKGNLTYNLGANKREAIVGLDSVHGYMEKPQVPFMELEITDRADLDVEKLLNITDSTIMAELANGKVIQLRNAWYAGDGNVGSEEGNIQARFEGKTADEIR